MDESRLDQRPAGCSPADVGVWSLAPGHELEMDVLELSAWKRGGHNAAACKLGSDTVQEWVRIDLRTRQFDSVDDGPGLAIDHPAGYCRWVLIPWIVARPELVPVQVHEDVANVVCQ